MGWVTVGAGLFAVTLVVGLGAVALVRDRSLTATVAQAGVTVVFGLVGLFLSVYGTANVIQGRASASWSAAEGTVVESTIERVRYSKRNEERAVVRYEFNANGRRYTGDRIAFATDDGYFGPTYRTGDRLHDILAQRDRRLQLRDSLAGIARRDLADGQLRT